MAKQPAVHWWNRLLGAAVGGPLLLGVVALLGLGWVGGRVHDIRTSPVILQQVQALKRLETARQTSHQVVKAASANPLLGELLSKDELTLVAVCHVTAGVDLARLTAADLAVRGSRVTVRLPAPEIFAVELDEVASEVVAREQGLLNFRADKDLEGEARREASQQARTAALSRGLLIDAETNAQAAIRGLLQQVGFEDVRFQGERG